MERGKERETETEGERIKIKPHQNQNQIKIDAKSNQIKSYEILRNPNKIIGNPRKS